MSPRRDDGDGGGSPPCRGMATPAETLDFRSNTRRYRTLSSCIALCSRSSKNWSSTCRRPANTRDRNSAIAPTPDRWRSSEQHLREAARGLASASRSPVITTDTNYARVTSRRSKGAKRTRAANCIAASISKLSVDGVAGRWHLRCPSPRGTSARPAGSSSANAKDFGRNWKRQIAARGRNHTAQEKCRSSGVGGVRLACRATEPTGAKPRSMRRRRYGAQRISVLPARLAYPALARSRSAPNQAEFIMISMCRHRDFRFSSARRRSRTNATSATPTQADAHETAVTLFGPQGTPAPHLPVSA
jgi:hypothetical protein